MPSKAVWRSVMLVFAAALGSCAADEVAPDPLISILAREKAQALAAARIGAAGGVLEITTGEYAGTALEVPPGALSKPVVFSIYPAKTVDESTGYRALGPMIRLAASAVAFRADATLRLPVSAESVTSESSFAGFVLLRRDEAKLAAVPGAAVDDVAAVGLISDVGDYGVAADLRLRPDLKREEAVLRCDRMSSGSSLQAAVNATRAHAQIWESTELLYAATLEPANGCGVSRAWTVAWFGTTLNRLYRYEYWSVAVSQPTVEDITPVYPCSGILVAYTGKADSPAMSDDLYVRLGETPARLDIAVRGCFSVPAQSPARVRLTVIDTGQWAEYSAMGTFLQSSF